MKWAHLKFNKEHAPLPRGGHSACLHNKTELYIFGGHDEDNNKL
ncbi:MAG: kelch repeat-containing protein [Candidatus Roizmanbacteria bacterium]